MSLQSKSLHRMLCLAMLAQATAPSNDAAAAAVTPSDCRPRDADSTCATAVAQAPPAQPPSQSPSGILYDGPLGGVPASGYAYWGFDFLADETGTPSAIRADEFINRSNVPVTIRLSFDVPTGRACNAGCLPRAEFEVDVGWFKIDPVFVVGGGTAYVTGSFAPGRGYGWAIGLWQASNARLTVSVPPGSGATLRDVGMSPFPAIATELPAVTGVCDCGNGTSWPCSDGSHFSNGLLGIYLPNQERYQRAGAFDDCLWHR